MDLTGVPVTCVHLAAMEVAARQARVPITQTGDWWGNGQTRNIYFACVLDEQKLRAAFDVAPHVEWMAWDGRAAGHEAGFYCAACNASLVGAHPLYVEVVHGRVWP